MVKRILALGLALALCLSFSVSLSVFSETPAPSSVIPGDADVSGTVTTTDARTILQASCGKQSPLAVSYSLADTDLSGDLSTTDARLALQTAAGKRAATPCEAVETTGEPLPVPVYESENRLFTTKADLTQNFLSRHEASLPEKMISAVKQFDDDFFAENSLLSLTTCVAYPGDVFFSVSGMTLTGIYADEKGLRVLTDCTGLSDDTGKDSYETILVPIKKHSGSAAISVSYRYGLPGYGAITGSVFYVSDTTFLSSDDSWMRVADTYGDFQAACDEISEKFPGTFNRRMTFNAFAAAHGEDYFETSSVILFATPLTRRSLKFKGFSKNEDGTLTLEVYFYRQTSEPGALTGIPPHPCIFALEVPKAALTGEVTEVIVSASPAAPSGTAVAITGETLALPLFRPGCRLLQSAANVSSFVRGEEDLLSEEQLAALKTFDDAFFADHTLLSVAFDLYSHEDIHMRDMTVTGVYRDGNDIRVCTTIDSFTGHNFGDPQVLLVPVEKCEGTAAIDYRYVLSDGKEPTVSLLLISVRHLFSEEEEQTFTINTYEEFQAFCKEMVGRYPSDGGTESFETFCAAHDRAYFKDRSMVIFLTVLNERTLRLEGFSENGDGTLTMDLTLSYPPDDGTIRWAYPPRPLAYIVEMPKAGLKGPVTATNITRKK